jgi:hypothetical protein
MTTIFHAVGLALAAVVLVGVPVFAVYMVWPLFLSRKPAN